MQEDTQPEIASRYESADNDECWTWTVQGDAMQTFAPCGETNESKNTMNIGMWPE